ncbi:MAG: pseudouridine synthase [Pseudomonadota bacterium]
MEPLSIVHQDAHILVIEKPSGLLTVAGKQPGTDDCLQSRAVAHHPGAEITHRLDWDTSGLIVLALNKAARRNLGMQFEKRLVRKHYIARVWGKPVQPSGNINLPMRCDWPNRPRQIIDHDQGKEAITDWAVTNGDETSSYLLMKPKTGRSHQLRVHCQSMGHPILGDRLYAHEEAYRAHQRMCLHATYIEFEHPGDGKRVSYESPCPF